jgi:hypothetical protein
MAGCGFDGEAVCAAAAGPAIMPHGQRSTMCNKSAFKAAADGQVRSPEYSSLCTGIIDIVAVARFEKGVRRK